MLPPAARLTRREDFATAVRRGRRAARGTVVAHWAASGTDAEPRAGFVVSKAVGNAVVRHRVQRRLRHLMRDRLAALPAHSLVVVRAVPAAALATSERLGEDLDQALRAVLRPRDPAGRGRPAERVP